MNADYSQQEPNRIAVVSYYPLRILTWINRESALNHCRKLLQIIFAEPHNLRCLQGMAGIRSGSITAKEAREFIFPFFIGAAKTSSG